MRWGGGREQLYKNKEKHPAQVFTVVKTEGRDEEST